MIAKHLKIIFVCLISCSSFSALAQDNLFDDDFVKSPIDKKKNDWQEKREPILDAKPIAKPASKNKNETSREKDQTLKVIDKDVIAVSNQTIRVKSLGLVLNCMDDEHFVSNMKSFKEVVTKHDFPVGSVICHGRFGLGYKSENKEMLAMIMMGADVKATYELPEPYDTLKRSPTWLVETDEGEYWLEGLNKSLVSFFTPKGYFVIPGDNSYQSNSTFSGGANLFE